MKKSAARAFEKSDKQADKKAGVREGSARDQKMDAKAMKQPAAKRKATKKG